MNASDMAALRRGGWVVINADGSTYNSDMLEAAIMIAAVGLALYWRWADAQRGRAHVIDMQQLSLFDTREEKAG